MCILPGIFGTPLLARNQPHVLEGLCKQVPFPHVWARHRSLLDCRIIENPYLNGEFILLDGALKQVTFEIRDPSEYVRVV